MQRFKTEEENGKLKSDLLCGIWVCLSTDTDCGGEPIAGKRVQTRFQKIEDGRQNCTHNTMWYVSGVAAVMCCLLMNRSNFNCLWLVMIYRFCDLPWHETFVFSRCWQLDLENEDKCDGIRRYPGNMEIRRVFASRALNRDCHQSLLVQDLKTSRKFSTCWLK